MVGRGVRPALLPMGAFLLGALGVCVSCTEKPLTDEELDRAKNLVETSFVVRLEGVRERASLLNMYQAEVKDPGFATKDLERYRRATKDQIRGVAETVLVPNARVVLRVVPKPKAKEPEKTRAPAAGVKK